MIIFSQVLTRYLKQRMKLRKKKLFQKSVTDNFAQSASMKSISISLDKIVRIFPHLDGIQRFTVHVQCKCREMRARKTPNMNTFPLFSFIFCG